MNNTITFKVTHSIVHLCSNWNETLFWSRLSQIISAHKIHLGTAFKWSCHFLFSRQETLHCCQTLFTKASLTQWYTVLEKRGSSLRLLGTKRVSLVSVSIWCLWGLFCLAGLPSSQQCFYSLGIRFLSPVLVLERCK